MPITLKNTSAASVPTPATDKNTIFTDGTSMFLKDDTGTVHPVAGSGTVTSVDITGADGVSASGGPITTSGNITVGLGDITPTSVVATGSISGTDFIASGNLELASPGNRIFGYFSSTTPNNVTAFQSASADLRTYVDIIPNGTNTLSGIRLFDNSDRTDASFLFAGISTTPGYNYIGSNVTGTGTTRGLLLGIGSNIGFGMLTNNDVLLGINTLTPSATSGHLYIQGISGTPTGTPTGYTNKAPLVVDTTNDKLYFYSNGSWIDSAGGSISAPLNEIVFGTGSGITSDPDFTFDTTTDTLVVGASANGSIFADTGYSMSIGSDGGTYSFTIETTGELNVNGDVGTSGQVLTSGGPGVPPTWQTVGGSISAPLNEIVFGTGSGITSDSEFTYNVTTGEFYVNATGGTLNDNGVVDIRTSYTSTATFSNSRIYMSAPGATDVSYIEFYSGAYDIGTSGGNNGGNINITAGRSQEDGLGGEIILNGGNGATGGAVHLYGGSGNSGSPRYGGDINIYAGQASGTGTGGTVYIGAGSGPTNSGEIKLYIGSTNVLTIKNNQSFGLGPSSISGTVGQVFTSTGASLPEWNYPKARSYTPSSSVGSAGDQAGMTAFDGTYFYVCIADYDGSTDIWTRVTLDTTPF